MIFSLKYLYHIFKLKEHGQYGIVGEPALEHAIQMEDNAQRSIAVTCHAQQPQLIQDPVNVSKD